MATVGRVAIGEAGCGDGGTLDVRETDRLEWLRKVQFRLWVGQSNRWQSVEQ